MSKNWDKRVEEEAIKFADDIEGVENHEICPKYVRFYPTRVFWFDVGKIAVYIGSK
ncbi:MAG: hypothetical protein WC276_06600 [Sedimentibacter sp.]